MTRQDRDLEREITPPEVFFNRRRFLRGGLVAAGAVGTGLLYRALNGVATDEPTPEQPKLAGLEKPAATGAPTAYTVDEPLTSLRDITHYNNFYEFSTDKDEVASAARGFSTADWRVEVGGLVEKPRTFDLADLLALAPPEERVYRLRCVEAWSMVIPWAGFSLSVLLNAVRPLGSAKYVAFQTLLDPTRMPNQSTAVLDWPYVEGLRLDEAMHPLTLLASGLYGRALPPQDGAPIRLVVPWKYGFKSIKSLVRITLTDEEPPTTWNLQAPDEYGFFANVNPNVAHPRWSQATEQRIGESGRRETLLFNGYAEQVASLYRGMDLREHF
ncbi:MAG: protein-methionine-sulfoxide reductase catalytic subunit MsrP [Deltaproteobacteria bacterium]|nr:protein-methionine-sulfoxide reductase catalytic subunit MsrP [Deltaproteobacteria bacterium]